MSLGKAIGGSSRKRGTQAVGLRRWSNYTLTLTPPGRWDIGRPRVEVLIRGPACQQSYSAEIGMQICGDAAAARGRRYSHRSSSEQRLLEIGDVVYFFGSAIIIPDDSVRMFYEAQKTAS